jgi:hypothetical protein
MCPMMSDICLNFMIEANFVIYGFSNLVSGPVLRTFSFLSCCIVSINGVSPKGLLH